MNGLFPEEDQNAYFFSRSDQDEPLGTHFAQDFILDGATWPSAEHYYQAMKFEDSSQREKIRHCEDPRKARKLGRSRFKKLRKDWKQVKTTVMSRALYTRCKTHPQAYQALMATDNQRLVENSSYDYFWGCGRDRRGDNHYGNVLMKVRNKLLEEQKESEKKND